MSPGIARCSTCQRVLPIRVTEELLEILRIAHRGNLNSLGAVTRAKTHRSAHAALLTVQCPTCRSITYIRKDDIERAA